MCWYFIVQSAYPITKNVTEGLLHISTNIMLKECTFGIQNSSDLITRSVLKRTWGSRARKSLSKISQWWYIIGPMPHQTIIINGAIIHNEFVWTPTSSWEGKGTKFKYIACKTSSRNFTYHFPKQKSKDLQKEGFQNKRWKLMNLINTPISQNWNKASVVWLTSDFGRFCSRNLP